MPSTESLESGTTRRGSKRTATPGTRTWSRAHAQPESQSVAVAQTKLGEGSRKTRSRGRMPTTAAATPGMTTRSRARTQQESQSAARTKTGERGKKMVKLDGISEPERARAETGEGNGCSKRAKLDGVSQPEGSKIKESQPMLNWEHEYEDWLNWSEDYDGGSSSSGSSAFSSPIRVPVPVNWGLGTNADSEIVKERREKNQTFYQKIVRQLQLPTLFPDTPPNCLVDDPTLLHIREPARKTVLRASQFVVRVSSSIDGQPLARCSGFWIDFDNESRTGTVVTTAILIRTKHPSKDAWFCKDQYACDAKVNVHLRGYITVEGDLLYYQKHYNLAFIRVKVDPSIQLPSYSDNMKCAQDVFELGRDERFILLINHGRVEYSNPTGDERYHHMYIQGPQRDRMYDIGGPVIDLDGKVVGMIDNCSRGSFIPSSVLLKCFHLWRNFQRIPRPHLGLKFNAISLLNPSHAEKILIECGIDEGLIIEEVSDNSPAEKCGIRNGDVIECLNGKSISTTVELENMLLSIMENIGDDLNSELDLEIQVYYTRRDLRRIKVLTVNVSDDGDYCVPNCATPPRRVT